MDSPINVESDDSTKEVESKDDDLNNLPDLRVIKKVGRPKKDAISSSPAGEVLKTLETISNTIADMMEKITMLSFRLDSVEKYTEHLKTVESPNPDNVELKKSAEPGKEDALITVVKKILGNGDIEKCQFAVTTKPDSAGGTFRLKIVPPEHLCEQDDDCRVKRLSYNEGISGAEIFAKTVLNRCIKFAQNKAISFYKE